MHNREHFVSKPISSKTLDEIGREWDRVAHIRHRQLENGQDLSFAHVLVPTIFGLLSELHLGRAIDLGSGTGELTMRLAEKAPSVVGVDISSTSIEIAKCMASGSSNVEFHCDSVEQFATKWSGTGFAVAIANMTLMDCPDLEAFVQGAASLLEPDGVLVATITHPWYWPQYWGYHNADWFKYNKEVAIESAFRTSTMATNCRTTHIHRPLREYIRVLGRAGFVIEQSEQPLPDAHVEHMFPVPWVFPRFLAVRARKVL